MLIAYTAEPGGESAERLELLRGLLADPAPERAVSSERSGTRR